MAFIPQELFDEKMNRVLSLAETKNKTIEYADLESVFDGMEMTEEQLDSALRLFDKEGICFMSESDLNEDDFEDTSDDAEYEEENRFGRASVEYSEDSLKLYLREIGTHPLLSADQERELFVRIDEGKTAKEQLAQIEEVLTENPEEKELWEPRLQELKAVAERGDEAKNRLAESNLRLVVSVAKRFHERNMDLLDLIQEGTFGLYKAIDCFDYRKGFKLSTYAIWWIREYISKAIAEQGGTISYSASIREQIKKMKRIRSAAYEETGTDPTPELIAEKMGVSVGTVYKYMAYSEGTESLHKHIGDDEDTELGDLIRDENALSPEGVFAYESMKEELEKALSKLDSREQLVVRLHFGLGGAEPCTMAQIAQRLSETEGKTISISGIKGIEDRALRKMKHSPDARKAAKLLED